MELTPKEEQLYEWISNFIAANNYSPTCREMMAGMELLSTAPLKYRLVKLRDKGYVTWQSGKARTLQLKQPI